MAVGATASVVRATRARCAETGAASVMANVAAASRPGREATAGRIACMDGMGGSEGRPARAMGIPVTIPVTGNTGDSALYGRISGAYR